MITFEGKYTTADVMGDKIDEKCSAQITELINHPAFTNHSVVMPDYHLGVGSVIGFTMPMPDKLVPNTIGKDMDCGLLANNLGKIDANLLRLDAIDRIIRKFIPFGFNVKHKAAYDMEKAFPFAAVQRTSIMFWRAFNKRFGTDYRPPSKAYTYKWFEMRCSSIGMNVDRAVKSLGTLGGGNHFIELGHHLSGDLWATVHSGSRQLGSKMCDYWQKRPAERKTMELKTAYGLGIRNIKEKYKGEEIGQQIKKLRAELGLDDKMVTKAMSYIEGEDMYGYLIDMIFAHHYARENRRIMMNRIRNVLGAAAPIDSIETTHNYIDFRDFVIRKGAVSAHKGERILIPFNMEDGILICEGKGNPDWNNSAPHGAGRMFSRSEAKKKFSSENAMKRMHNSGIYTSVVPADEVKEAYKNPQIIIEAIKPTVKIIGRIKPIMNLKDEDRKPKK